MKWQFVEFRWLRKNEVLLTCEGFSWRWKQYVHTTQNTNLTSTNNIYEKIDKQLEDFYHWRKTFIKTWKMWKVIIKWSFIANLLDLQCLAQKDKCLFRTDILSKTGTLMKLTQNLVTSPSSLWIRYLIKIIYMQWFALTRSPLPLHSSLWM